MLKVYGINVLFSIDPPPPKRLCFVHVLTIMDGPAPKYFC